MKEKKYVSNFIKVLFALMFALVVFTLILFYEKCEANKMLFALVFIPIIFSITNKAIDRFFNDKAFLDIRLCDYQHLLPKNILDVWAIPEIKQEELADYVFIEIKNIGESMIKSVKVIINHNSDKENKNYAIYYVLKREEVIYLAISEKLHNIKNITVIFSAEIDKGINFYNECEKDSFCVFSRIKETRRNRHPVNIECVRFEL